MTDSTERGPGSTDPGHHADQEGSATRYCVVPPVAQTRRGCVNPKPGKQITKLVAQLAALCLLTFYSAMSWTGKLVRVANYGHLTWLLEH
jgi:hypothetical protein